MASLNADERHHLLDPAGREAAGLSFFVDRREGVAIGAGAWLRTGEHERELKRRFVSPDAQGL